MDQGDIIRITDVQALEGYPEPILNVYHYQVMALTDSVPLPVYAEELANAFYDAVIQYLLPIQVSSLTHVRLDFENLTFQQEIASYTWETPYAGLDVSDYLPSNVAYSFRLVRYNRLTRNGRKSISGVADTAVVGGRNLAPAYVAAVSTAAQALGTFFPVEGETTDATMLPVIVRIPANPGVSPTVFNPITQAVFRGFGTQNTRKAL